MRCWGRFAVAGMTAVVSSLVVSSPSGATPSHPGGVPDTCPEVLAGRPTGGVQKLTSPPPESTVSRGAVIAVTLRWDPAAFATPRLHKVLDCATVDGEAADGLSLQERDPANGGEFTLQVVVPEGLDDGTRLCDRGFVSGPGPNGAFVRQKSNDVCFTVRGDTAAQRPAPAAAPQLSTGSPAPATTPTPPPTAFSVPPVTPMPVLSSAPIVALAPAPPAGPADTGLGAAGGGAPGTEVAGATEVNDTPVPVLPRTGAPIGPTTAAGLAALLTGVLVRRWAVRPTPVAEPGRGS